MRWIESKGGPLVLLEESQLARERLAGHRVDTDALAQPTLAVVVAVALVPRLARAPMTLSSSIPLCACTVP